MMAAVTRPHLLVPLLALALVAAACGGGDPDPSSPPSITGALDPASLVVQVASTDLYVDEPQRVTVGVFANDPESGPLLVTSGEIEIEIAPFADGAGTPVSRTARYLPAPGTGAAETGPTLTDPATARGVYEAGDVRFDAPGVWEATVSVTVDGEGPFTLAATPFQVDRQPSYPAPGDPALHTENLTIHDDDVPPAAIDSRADDDTPVPDPELHDTTIAQAIRQGRPALVLFATPTFCESLFCGPVTDALDELAGRYEDRAAFIHVEVWRENPTVLNEAAADWLYRDDNLTEPWLYLIGADGVIVDRWAPLFDVDEVAALLEQLPATAA